ncbi:MAG: HAD family phosphatase, partial [Verrucomicrobia bacterium]|nr:HAD family phosphatase [Verrucomicrobiota bacterium]
MKTQWSAIFDWDGVILDSSRHHEESWERLAKEEGRILPEGHFLKGFGRRNVEIMRDMLRWSEDLAEIQRLSLRKEELYREVVKDWGIESLPGVREWLERLKKEGIACGIGSSTEEKNVRLGLGLLGLGDFFQTAVTAEHVKRGKPAPDVFLEVARRLDANPAQCVVFEDAPAGVEAGRAAGVPDLVTQNLSRGRDQYRNMLDGLMSGNSEQARDSLMELQVFLGPKASEQVVKSVKDVQQVGEYAASLEAQRDLQKAKFEAIHNKMAKVNAGEAPYSQGVR